MAPDGIIRAKAVTPYGLESLLASGVGLTSAQTSITVFDTLPPQSAYQPVGELRIIPDPSTFTILPYLQGHARMLSDLMTIEGEPWELCPRGLLKRTLRKLHEYGLIIQASFENEFTLYEQQGNAWFPFGKTPSFSSESIDQSSDFILGVITALKNQGVYVEKFYPESAPGQFELPICHQPGLSAADQQVVFRETLRGVALAHKKRVSLMPKPATNWAGNGCHIHFSLWDNNNRNVLYDRTDDYELSLIGHQFIAGILDHLDGLLAFTAPTTNSYKRFVKHGWASCYRCWGPDNREASIRLASSFSHAPEKTLNLEYRAADPTCNPYLAMAAVTLAGLSGIERKLELVPPVLSDPALLSLEERSKYRISVYPSTLEEALDSLEKDEYMTNAIGKNLTNEYLIMKRHEIETINTLSGDAEIDTYRFLF